MIPVHGDRIVDTSLTCSELSFDGPSPTSASPHRVTTANEARDCLILAGHACVRVYNALSSSQLMGAGHSTASSAHPPARALHVLRVTPSSPASQTNIEPFFDFVVGFQGDSISSRRSTDASELERIVENHEGKTLNLLVWNSKSQETRGRGLSFPSFHSPLPLHSVVEIIPSRLWSLPHPDARDSQTESKPSLLGLSMRMCEPEFAPDNVWHVLDVLEGSPSESAGLVPYGDWIVGWSGGVLSAEGDFYDVVEAVSLVVYSCNA
jgi:GRASP55/65 PDZ-like domain